MAPVEEEVERVANNPSLGLERCQRAISRAGAVVFSSTLDYERRFIRAEVLASRLADYSPDKTREKFSAYFRALTSRLDGFDSEYASHQAELFKHLEEGLALSNQLLK